MKAGLVAKMKLKSDLAVVTRPGAETKTTRPGCSLRHDCLRHEASRRPQREPHPGKRMLDAQSFQSDSCS